MHFLNSELTCHMTDYSVEVSLVLVVDKTVMKHSLAFMAEKTKYLGLCYHFAWITL